jgi:ribonuclease P protein component
VLASQNRLRDRVKIKRVLERGRVVSGGLMRLKFLPQRGIAPQLTVVVSNRVSKHSTIRNRIKRLIRAGLEELIKKEMINFDAIVYGQSRAIKSSLSETKEELSWLVEKAKKLIQIYNR